jgi:CO/xanthine dehydrogenase Mo-binding subunit
LKTSRKPLTRAIGANVPRKDAVAKVTGAARYVDDLTFPGMIFGRTIRSEIACGDLVAVRYAFDTGGFTIVDARDIPGRNVIAMIQDDQPCLVEGEIRHAEEPIVLLAHEDREMLAAAKVVVETERREPLFDPEESTHAFKTIAIDKGDVAAGFAAADHVIEGEYRTGHQEHVAIETNGVIAVPGDGRMTVWGSLQCPYYVHRALVTLLGLPAERVRVIQAETGGGFGGKEDYPSIIAGHAALLAWKSGRPVKIVYDRVEDMVATTKRHPSIVRHRTGVRSDGRITAIDVDVLLDGGAYCTLSPVVLSRGVLHATGPYRCDHVRIRGRAVMTNTPPNGAFRGFGAPQTQFAAEVHADRVAAALGMDPVQFRAINALRPGDTTATGQLLGRDASALRVLREAVRRTQFSRRRKLMRGTNRGLGVSLFFHGSGFTGAGEVKLASRAALELLPRGVRILVASTEIGQGTRTMHAQIVADAMGIPYDAVLVSEADTGLVPDSGPTVASRTCMIVGRILEACAREMKARLGRFSNAEFLRRHGPLVVEKSYERPAGMTWDDDAYRGDAYGAFGWGCNVAEVSIDPDTCEVTPVRLTAVLDVGKAIHPTLVAGQIEGGTAQGVGMALIERVVMKDGRMANAQLTNYAIPTTLDTPRIDVGVVEAPYAHGPAGAKGVGEMPIDGPAPAIVNAIRAAGLDVREIPATPEVLLNVARATGWRPRP